MFLLNGLCGRGSNINTSSLEAKAKPYIVNKGWKKLREDCTPIWVQVAGGEKNNVNINVAQQYFKLVGERYFGQDLSSILSKNLFDRFDYQDDGTMGQKAAFRALRKGILARCTAVTPDCPMKSGPEECGYLKEKVLAKGGQGAAWLAKTKPGNGAGLPAGTPIVLKQYDKQNANAGGLQELIDEYQTMKLMDNVEAVMTAYEIFQDQSALWCVNELCAGGDLASLRKNCAASWVNLTYGYWQALFKQCVKGMQFVHRKGIMHCDIKEPNLMLKHKNYASPNVVIIDLGMAQATASSGMAGGTPGYRPPETNKDNVWFPKGDIFALGVTFFQLLADKVPDEKTGKMGIFQEGARSINDVYSFTATREPPWQLVSNVVQQADIDQWLKPMLAKDINQRPRAFNLMKKSFFANAPDAPPPSAASSGVGGCFQC